VKAAMIKAVTTKIVQDVPLGTGEGQFPAMENTIADLPSKEFFLKNLDAPGRLDENGNVLPLAPAPERQVNNNAPTAIASQTTP
jgi:hypothetical protein